MLLQIDGSIHHWLKGGSTWLCLIYAVDDAIGKVPYALFNEQETTGDYLLLQREIVLKRGLMTFSPTIFIEIFSLQ